MKGAWQCSENDSCSAIVEYSFVFGYYKQVDGGIESLCSHSSQIMIKQN